jgi:hypothetical protein
MGLPVDVLSEKRETQVWNHHTQGGAPAYPSLGLRVSTLLPQEAIANEHNEYLQKHPEIQQILNDFVSAALVEMPDDVFHFARKHFAAPETAKETAHK